MSRFSACLILIVMMSSGCGGPMTGSVSGKVTINGKPLSSGMIVLVAENKMSFSVPIKDGSYSIEKVPTGKASVAVRDVPPPSAEADPSKMPDPSKPAPLVQPAANMVAPKFQQPQTSGLSLSVAKGENKGDFDLK